MGSNGKETTTARGRQRASPSQWKRTTEMADENDGEDDDGEDDDRDDDKEDNHQGEDGDKDEEPNNPVTRHQ
jgi:hypothetical protein